VAGAVLGVVDIRLEEVVFQVVHVEEVEVGVHLPHIPVKYRMAEPQRCRRERVENSAVLCLIVCIFEVCLVLNKRSFHP